MEFHLIHGSHGPNHLGAPLLKTLGQRKTSSGAVGHAGFPEIPLGADEGRESLLIGCFLSLKVPSWTTLLTSPPSGSPRPCSSGPPTSLTTSCACVMSSRCSSASASSLAVGSGTLSHLLLLPGVDPPLVLRDPLHVPRPALHLLLGHPVQRLTAVGGEHGAAARPGNGHDHLHDQSELLPPRQGAGVPGLEEGRLRWR